MTIEIVYTVLKGLNQIPAGKGVLDRISPLTIVTRQETVDYNKPQASFSKYAQVYEENGRNNTNVKQSIRAI